jgi:type I restriction enzyme S subunit
MNDGWKEVPMGELCTITSGKSNTQDAIDGGLYMFFDRSKTPKRSARFLYNCEALIIPGEGTEFIPRHFVGKFDLHQRAYALFDFVPSVDVRYLFFYLVYFKHWFAREAVGATVKSLRRRHFTELPVIVPPLPEQRRIVAILDEAFAGIDAAIANAEKNLANAQELLGSYQDSVIRRAGNTWMEGELGEIVGSVFTGPFGSLLHKADYVVSAIPLVNPANIIAGKVVPDNNKTVDQRALERLESYMLQQGDIVFGRRGEMGRCAVINEAESGWLCGTGSFFIRPLPTADPDFVVHLLRSRSYRANLERVATGATMKNLSNKALSRLRISLPPIEEQREINNRLDQIASQLKRLEMSYRSRSAALSVLKQSIIQKAFAGELTAEVADDAAAA